MVRVKINPEAKQSTPPKRKKRYPGKGKQVGTKARELPKRKIGRPTKRNADTERAILQVLKLGLGYGCAAAAAGISDTTLKEWRNGDPDFAQKCEQAKSDHVKLAAATLHLTMRRGGPGAIQAAMFVLKTHSPEYREKVKLEVGEDEHQDPDESFL